MKTDDGNEHDAVAVRDDVVWPELTLVLRGESGREEVVLDEIHKLMNRDDSQDDWFAYFGLLDESLQKAYGDFVRAELRKSA